MPARVEDRRPPLKDREKGAIRETGKTHQQQNKHCWVNRLRRSQILQPKLQG
jgi:hypothetical protein